MYYNETFKYRTFRNTIVSGIFHVVEVFQISFQKSRYRTLGVILYARMKRKTRYVKIISPPVLYYLYHQYVRNEHTKVKIVTIFSID